MSSALDRAPIRVVVSQPMYFPWVGLLEQIRLADVFVFYDDVQFARGFFNRVQIKTSQGTPWLTVPTVGKSQDLKINEVRLESGVDWRMAHRAVLAHAYAKAKYRDDMLALAERAMSMPAETLADVGRNSIMELAGYFGLLEGRRFLISSELGIGGSGSQRLFDIVKALGGSIYITGHGARRYLDHELFERDGIAVEYMKYEMRPYPQLYGAFTPFVTALDLAANCGREGRSFISSGTVGWRDFEPLLQE